MGSEIWDNLATLILCLEPVYAPKLDGDFVSPPMRPTLPPIFLSLFTPHPLPLRQTERFVPQVRLIVEVVESSKRRCNVVLALFRSKYVVSAPCHSSIFALTMNNIYRPEPVERTIAAAGTAEEEEG